MEFPLLLAANVPDQPGRPLDQPPGPDPVAASVASDGSVAVVGECSWDLSPEHQVVWDDIAERNTKALEEMQQQWKDGWRPTKCTVEEIPNPFMSCT